MGLCRRGRVGLDFECRVAKLAIVARQLWRREVGGRARRRGWLRRFMATATIYSNLIDSALRTWTRHMMEFQCSLECREPRMNVTFLKASEVKGHRASAYQTKRTVHSACLPLCQKAGQQHSCRWYLVLDFLVVATKRKSGAWYIHQLRQLLFPSQHSHLHTSPRLQGRREPSTRL